MIKVKNNIATREPIPEFLRGLDAASLADLTWTDPSLGVHDCAWWREVDESPALQQYQRYGDEALTVDADARVVRVVRSVVPWTADEIAAAEAEAQQQARQAYSVVSMRQARLALLASGRLADVTAAIAAIPDATARQAAQIEWEYAHEVHRDSAFVQQLGAALGLDDAALDALFAQAVTL